MLRWLQTNYWLTGWLSLLVMVVSLFMQNVKSNFQEIDWSRSLLYIAFLTGLAVVITPSFDEKARYEGSFLISVLLFFLIIDRKPRA